MGICNYSARLGVYVEFRNRVLSDGTICFKINIKDEHDRRMVEATVRGVRGVAGAGISGNTLTAKAYITHVPVGNRNEYLMGLEDDCIGEIEAACERRVREIEATPKPKLHSVK